MKMCAESIWGRIFGSADCLIPIIHKDDPIDNPRLTVAKYQPMLAIAVRRFALPNHGLAKRGSALKPIGRTFRKVRKGSSRTKKEGSCGIRSAENRSILARHSPPM